MFLKYSPPPLDTISLVADLIDSNAFRKLFLTYSELTSLRNPLNALCIFLVSGWASEKYLNCRIKALNWSDTLISVPIFLPVLYNSEII